MPSRPSLSLGAAILLNGCVKARTPETVQDTAPTLQEEVCDLQVERAALVQAMKDANYHLDGVSEALAAGTPPKGEDVCRDMTTTSDPNSPIYRAEACALRLERERFDTAMTAADGDWERLENTAFHTPTVNQAACGDTVQFETIKNIPKDDSPSVDVVLADGTIGTLTIWPTTTELVHSPPNRVDRKGARSDWCDLQHRVGPFIQKGEFQDGTLTAVQQVDGPGGYTRAMHQWTGAVREPLILDIPRDEKTWPWGEAPESYRPEQVAIQQGAVNEALTGFISACEAQLGQVAAVASSSE